MFGYVSVYKPELKVKEYELYRGAYCGLCRSMGKCTGQCSRMTLSYDFVFLALVRMGLSGEAPEYARGRCLAHPIKSGTYLKDNPTFRYCSSAAALLNYHKVKDDIADEKGFKRLASLFALPFVSHSRRKALKIGYAELDTEVSECLSKLSALEKESVSSINAPAAVFGELLGNIMSHGLPDSDSRIAYSLGSVIGKWIYIADALEDWEKDAKKGAYNPFVLLYQKSAPSNEDIEDIKIALKNELFSAEAAFDLIEFGDIDTKNVVSNILYIGLPARIDAIKFGKDLDGKRKDKI